MREEKSYMGEGTDYTVARFQIKTIFIYNSAFTSASCTLTSPFYNRSLLSFSSSYCALTQFNV